METVYSYFIYFLFLISSLLLAITVHEAAHAWAAKMLGDFTADNEGRVSLNPLVHLDPLGTLMIFFAGFGWGKPVPYNPKNLKNPKRDEILIALAGPAANFVTATLFASMLSLPFSSFLTPFFAMILLNFFKILISLNIALFVFNLIPIPPLDGSKLLHPFISKKNEHLFESFRLYGPLVLLVIIAFEHAFGIPTFSFFFVPLHDLVWSFVLFQS